MLTSASLIVRAAAVRNMVNETAGSRIKIRGMGIKKEKKEKLNASLPFKIGAKIQP